MRNEQRKFVCRPQRLRVESIDTVFSCAFAPCEEVTIVIKHGEGNYRADPDTLRRIEENKQVVFRYIDNPNGSLNDIAGVTNEHGNVVGLMPHPEHNVEDLSGESHDGALVFKSLLTFLKNRA
jgi:phosphoribosylformylglycinamidine synthase